MLVVPSSEPLPLSAILVAVTVDHPPIQPIQSNPTPDPLSYSPFRQPGVAGAARKARNCSKSPQGGACEPHPPAQPRQGGKPAALTGGRQAGTAMARPRCSKVGHMQRLGPGLCSLLQGRLCGSWSNTLWPWTLDLAAERP